MPYSDSRPTEFIDTDQLNQLLFLVIPGSSIPAIFRIRARHIVVAFITGHPFAFKTHMFLFYKYFWQFMRDSLMTINAGFPPGVGQSMFCTGNISMVTLSVWF